METVEPGQAPNPVAAPAVATPEPAKPEPKPPKTSEDYEQIISDLRKENADRRTKLTEFEKAEAKRKEAEMSDTEKAQAKLKELEDKVAATSRKAQDSEIKAHAALLGFADPSDAAAFIDREKIDEDGTNIPDLLKAVLKAKPYLAKDQKAIPGTNSGNPGGGADKASEKAKEAELRKAFPSLDRR